MSTNDPNKVLLKDRIYIPSLQYNDNTVNYSRTIISILTGCIAGILGINGWLYGSLFYIITSQLINIGILYQYKSNINIYIQSIYKFILDSITNGVLSFVMFWTLLYNIVHVYQ